METMIKKMVEAEKRWTKYVTKGLLGFTDRTIDVYLEDCANDICKNLKIPTLYPHPDVNPLRSILDKKIKGDKFESRTNFFEANPTEYSKGSIEVDY